MRFALRPFLALLTAGLFAAGLLAVALAPATAHAQRRASDVEQETESSRTYQSVETETYRSPTSDGSAARALPQRLRQASLRYVGATGKATQTVQVAQTPRTLRDVVQPVVYDELGRQTRTYLAYPASDSSGTLRTGAAAEAVDYYENDSPLATEASAYPYSEKRMERSPLGRTEETGGRGAAYQLGQNTTRTYKRTNAAGEIYHRLAVPVSPAEGTESDYEIDVRGAYPARTLFKKITSSPDGDSTVVVKDRNGNKVLKRTFLPGTDGAFDPAEDEVATTYYVHDRRGNLRFIIPPQLVAQVAEAPGRGLKTQELTEAQMDNWVTEYKYDGYGRQVAKLMPEEEPVTKVYDRLGRVVLEQDGLLRENGDWLFKKYDPRGRLVYKGIWRDLHVTDGDPETEPRTRAELQQILDGESVYHERRKAVPSDPGTASAAIDTLGYTRRTFPQENLYVWQVKYYDNYDFDRDGQSEADFEPVDSFPRTSTEENSLYGTISLEPFKRTRRVADKATRTLTRVFQQLSSVLPPGTYTNCPEEPDTLYVVGETTLKPEFECREDQEVKIGPNVEVPDGYEPETIARAGEPTMGVAMGVVKSSFLRSTTYYDEDGRSIQTIQTHLVGGTTTSSIQYTFAGKTKRTVTVHDTPHSDVTVRERHVYDRSGRRVRTWRQHNGGEEVLAVEVAYDETGSTAERRLYSTDAKPGDPIAGPTESIHTFSQRVDLMQTIQGWQKSMNDPRDQVARDGNETEARQDLFEMALRYENPTGSVGPGKIDTEARYNGQIAAMRWQTGRDGPDHEYAYTYDALGRLQKADYASIQNGSRTDLGRYAVETLRYDLSGNIQRVQRHAAGGLADDLTYHYGDNGSGNQLRSVSETAAIADTLGYPSADPGQDTVFTYDPNGNRMADSTRGVYATYSYLNVPDQIRVAGNGTIRWTWSATGRKLAKTVYPNTGEDGPDRVTTHYAAGYVYQSSTSADPVVADTTLRFFAYGEGRIVAERSAGGETGPGDATYTRLTYEYHLSDHLGNTRVAFVPAAGGDSVRVVQKSNYYPYGLRWARQQTIAGQTSRNEHLYNGKELAEELGLNWYHYGARYYDVALARWAEMDPADEFHSPYTYVGNDPVNLTDPDGASSESPLDYFMDEDGNIRWFDSTSETVTDASGNEWSNIGSGYLAFDGNTLTYRTQVTVGGEMFPVSHVYSAVSGTPLGNGTFDYSKERQMVKGKGPIPEGYYSVNPQKIQSIGWGDWVGGALSGLSELAGLGPVSGWPGGEYAWGERRVWISPRQNTYVGPNGNKVTRSGFSIHGGWAPGSAGCIDLCGDAPRFFNQLGNSSSTRMMLKVSY